MISLVVRSVRFGYRRVSDTQTLVVRGGGVGCCGGGRWWSQLLPDRGGRRCPGSAEGPRNPSNSTVGPPIWAALPSSIESNRIDSINTLLSSARRTRRKRARALFKTRNGSSNVSCPLQQREAAHTQEGASGLARSSNRSTDRRISLHRSDATRSAPPIPHPQAIGFSPRPGLDQALIGRAARFDRGATERRTKDRSINHRRSIDIHTYTHQ